MHQFGKKKPKTTKNPEKQTSEDSSKRLYNPKKCNNGSVMLSKYSLEQPVGATDAPLNPNLLTSVTSFLTQHFFFPLLIL